MEVDPTGERSWNKHEILFAGWLAFCCVCVVTGAIAVYTLYAENKINGALSCAVVFSIVSFGCIFMALYHKRRIPNPRAVRPANLEAQAHQLEMREAAADPGCVERLNVDADNSSASSSDDPAVPDPPCLQPPDQPPSGEPSSSSLASSGEATRPVFLHSGERSSLLASVPGRLSSTLPDVAVAVCEVGSKCAAGSAVETQTASVDHPSPEDSTENEAEQSDNGEIRCRKRSPVPNPED